MTNDKTIKQLADEIGVSKQTIQKIIEKMPDKYKPIKLGNRYLLSLENQVWIKKKLGFQIDIDLDISDNISDKTNISNNNSDNSNKDADKIDNSDISEYLNVILNQLDIKDKQIEKLQKLLDQQQILTLQANKKIEELELKNEETENSEGSEGIEEKIKKEPQKERKSFFQRLFGK